MSKILRLLVKAQLHKGPFPLGHGLMAHGPQIPAAAKACEVGDDLQTTSMIGLKRAPLKRLLIALIALMGVTIMVALAVIKHTVAELNSTKETLVQLARGHQVDQLHLAQLQSTLDLMNQQQSVQTHELTRKLAALEKQFAQSSKEWDELSVNQGIMKVMVDDLKTTDRLMLDKTIAVNHAVESLKKNLDEIKSANAAVTAYQEISTRQ